MRKWILPLITVLLLCLCATAGADTAFTFENSSSTVTLSDQYIILTPDNLSSHQEWLTNAGKDAETLLADWEARGVQLQAWTPDGDACCEIIIRRDEDARTYFDVDQQTTQMRASFRTAFLKGEAFKAEGYKVQVAEWKKTAEAGRFLKFKYSRTVDGTTYHGYMRRTIRNGWTVIIDYQVYGRGLRDKDLASADKVMNAWRFTKVLDMPDDTLGLLEFTSVPPAETNTGKFTVEGQCYPGASLIGVVMKMADPNPTRFEATANKAGKFKMPVKLPSEGVWLMTLTIEYNNVVIADHVFDTTNYQSSLLPVNWTDAVPELLTEDTTVISGVTAKNVSVQCLVTSSSGKNFEKLVRTNASGKFSFKVPTDAEGSYSIVIVLQKKNFTTRRFTWETERRLTEENKKQQVREIAVKPAYSTLTKKINGYTGKTMVYTVYVQKAEQVGDEWIVFAAMNKTAKGVLKNTLVIICEENPGFSEGQQARFYGKCTGTYQVQSEEGNESYPSFDLLFWD